MWFDRVEVDNQRYREVYYDGPKDADDLAELREKAIKWSFGELTPEQTESINAIKVKQLKDREPTIVPIRSLPGISRPIDRVELFLVDDSVWEEYHTLTAIATLVYPQTLGRGSSNIRSHYPRALAYMEFGVGI